MISKPVFSNLLRTTNYCSFLLLFFAQQILAQQSGALIGTVLDPSGAPVASSEIEILNTSTQVLRSLQADSAGSYESTGLLPGTYRISAKAKGFATKVVDNVLLSFGARIRVDIPLVVGEVSSTVNVNADLAVIETESPRITQVLTSKKVLDLPYNQLGTLNLGRFVPGTYPASGNFEWSSAGGGNTQIGQSFDGIVVNNGNGGMAGGYYYSPSLDAVQEVSYTVSNQSAENSFATTYAVITKSGGPEFHGSGWLYLSNNEWNARNFFAATAPVGQLNRRYGGTLGGPIYKTRTFFFADIQFDKTNNLRQYNDLVPTDKIRSGDFSGLTPIRSPFGGVPYPNNIIPPSEINQTSRGILDFYYQKPTIARDVNFGFFNQTATFQGQLQHYNFRIDHRFNEKHSVNGRLSRQRYNDFNNLAPANPSWGEIRRVNPTWFVSTAWTWVTSPRTLNDFRLGWNDAPDESSSSLNGAEVVRRLGLTGHPGALPSVATVPAFAINGISSFPSPRVPIRLDTIWNISDTFSIVRAKQTIKLGFHFRPVRLFQQLPELQGLFGSANFTGGYTGLGTSDFLLGLPQTSTVLARADDLNRRVNQFGLFVQNDVRISNRLTLNLGLRFERNHSPRETRGGLLFIFDPQSGRIVVPGNEQLNLVDPALRATIPFATASEVNFPAETLIGQRDFLWYPRVGLAYRPFADTRTVIRLGYGIYAIDNANLNSPVGGGPYNVNLTYDNSITSAGARFRLPQMFPASGGGRTVAPGTFSLTTQERERRVPYSQQWNVTLEHQLQTDLSLRLTYQGSKTTSLPYGYNLNQPLPSTEAFSQSRRPYPLYRDIFMREFRGHSLFHGMVAVLSKRFSKGLGVDLSYLWARDLSDAFTFNGGNTDNRYNFAADRGNSPFTPRQRFTMQGMYELPFGKGRSFGKNAPAVAQAIIGGWQLSSVLAIQTGTFFHTTFSGADVTNTQVFSGRADVNRDWRVSDQSIRRWFDRGAFSLPAAGRFGNVGPFSMAGPGRWTLDALLFKEIAFFGEKRFVRFEGSFINVMNHANFSNPVANITLPTAGTIVSTNGIEGGGGRTIQVGIRYRF
jgi:hypothetical protein